MRHLVVAWAARGAGLAIGAGAVLLLALLAAAALKVLALAFIAILLAAALEPMVGAIRARFHTPRSAAILLVYAGFFALVAAFSVLILPAAIGQAQATVTRLPGFLDQVEAWASDLRPEPAGRTVLSLVDAARDAIRPAVTPRPNEVVQAGLTLADVLGSMGAMLALVFFWLMGHARFQRYVLSFVAHERRAGVRDTWNEIEGRLGLWLRGQLIVMATVGLMAGVAYVVLGVPSALLLALIAALLEAVPMVGPILGAIPALLAAATVSPGLVVGVLIAATIVQLIENNILVPIIMRNTIGLSPFVVTITLLFGAAVGGIFGALLAVPIAAVLEVIGAHLQDRRVPVAQEPGTAEGTEHHESELDAAPRGSRCRPAPGATRRHARNRSLDAKRPGSGG